MKILVCDGRSRAALQIVRSLSTKGTEVYVGESFFCQSFLSNSIKAKIRYPNPDTKPKTFLNFIETFVKKNNIDLVFPVRDSSTEILSKNKAQLLPCKVFSPDFESMQILQRKDKLTKLAKGLGVPCPRTHFGNCKKLPTFENISKEVKLPFIAKPTHSSGSRGIYLIHSDLEFQEFIKIERENLSAYIFQEFIPHGGAVGVYSICKDGVPIARNTHIRIREYPHSGGPSTLRRSGKNQLCEYFAEEIWRKVNWNGPSMVEFRIHKITKIPYLMEVNTRFWGSLAVDIHSGVDFPKIAMHTAMFGEDKWPRDFAMSLANESDSFNSKPFTKVYVRWLFLGDILWLITHPKKIDAFIKFLDFKKQKFDILSWQDPLPVFGALLEGLISLTNRKRRQHAFTRGWNE